MTRPFSNHFARKPQRSPRRIATIDGRPAWQVLAERAAQQQEQQEQQA